jgi:hypothetical protein
VLFIGPQELSPGAFYRCILQALTASLGASLGAFYRPLAGSKSQFTTTPR